MTPQWPVAKVEIALANNPGDSSLTWTDISAYVDKGSGKTGRSNDLDKIEAGTATIDLLNDDRRFDPTYTSGPYTGQLLPSKRIRITASWPAVSNLNLLTLNQSSFESGTTGWANDGHGTGSTQAQSSAQALDGTYSLSVTASNGGSGNTGVTTPIGNSGVAVTAGATYTALASVRAKTNSELAQVRIYWYDVSTSEISSSDGSATADSTSAWTNLSVTGTAPVGATHAAIVVRWLSDPNAEVHYLDCAGLYAGTVSTWEAPPSSYPVFYGLVEGWPQSYTDSGFRSIVSLKVTDLFRSLAAAELNNTYASGLTGARINAVLDDLGWPAGDRDIDAGQSTIQAVTLAGTKALAHLQEVADSENGLLFISRDGKVTFIDRAALILAPLDTTLVWGEAEYPYEDITLAPDDSNLINDVTVTADGLADQNAQSAASITKYLKRSLTRSTLLSSTGQMLDLANFLVSRFSEPATRVSSMDLSGQPTTTVPFILARDIGDKIIVRRRPTVGSLIEQDSVIEARSFAFSEYGWSWSFDLSPVDSVSNYWVLGDTTQSLLGSTTRMGY